MIWLILLATPAVGVFLLWLFTAIGEEHWEREFNDEEWDW